MSFSASYDEEYGELIEYEAPMIIGDTDGPCRSQMSSSSINLSTPATDRLSSTRCFSEISMDFGDLLLEDNYTSGSVSGSMVFNNALSDDSTSQRQQQQRQRQLNYLVCVEEDADRKSDDNIGSGYCNYRAYSHDVNRSIIKFDEVPISNGSSSRSSFHSSNGSLKSHRKVHFEISTRLEDIQEYEKPDIEDNHMLYYTAHELQKMIDGQRAEEQRKVYVVR